MKYCSKCGAQIADGARFCSMCGAPVGGEMQNTSGLKFVAEIFMLLGCIASGWALIPLCWTVPMTVKYFKSVKAGRDVGTGFKVCTLLFVSLVAGILMLVDGDSEN